MDETMKRIKELYRLIDNREDELIDGFLNDSVKADDKADFFFKESKRLSDAAGKIVPCEILLRFLCDIIHEYDAEEIFSRFKSGVYTEPRPW